MFIVLEGIDCSGKSSVTETLANKLGGVAYATPPEKYRSLRKKIDFESNLGSHYEFYRQAVIEASTEISQMLATGTLVVCDRYWLSTLVYHRAGGMIIDQKEFAQIVQPDLTVFLVVSPETQKKREDSRKTGNKGNLDGVQEILTNLYWQALMESKLPFLVVHTDNITTDQCSNIIAAALT
jgi:thymidylate kinase